MPFINAETLQYNALWSSDFHRLQHQTLKLKVSFRFMFVTLAFVICKLLKTASITTEEYNFR